MPAAPLIQTLYRITNTENVTSELLIQDHLRLSLPPLGRLQMIGSKVRGSDNTTVRKSIIEDYRGNSQWMRNKKDFWKNKWPKKLNPLLPRIWTHLYIHYILGISHRPLLRAKSFVHKWSRAEVLHKLIALLVPIDKKVNPNTSSAPESSHIRLVDRDTVDVQWPVLCSTQSGKLYRC